MDLGFKLVGRNATWTFHADHVVIEYATSLGVPRLLRRIGRRVVPNAAIADAGVGRGDGVWVLWLILRAGADPYLTAAAGQLPDDHDPHRLELDTDQADLATFYARDLRLRAGTKPPHATPSPIFLLAAGPPPLRLKCYDGEAHLDADVLRFRWNSAASPIKRALGTSVYPLSALESAEWVRPGLLSGHLAVHVTGDSAGTLAPEDDPRVILFGLGYGGLAHSLPFAASLLAEIQRNSPDGRPAAALALGDRTRASHQSRDRP